MNSVSTRWAFLAGVFYFSCMAVAHYLSVKVPILFVYYDTPFHAYQDKIISFAVCAYVALFYAASQHRVVAIHAIVVLGVTALGLSSVNLSEDLTSVMVEGQSRVPYWLQTGGIFLYVLLLTFLYMRDGRRESESGGKGKVSETGN